MFPSKHKARGFVWISLNLWLCNLYSAHCWDSMVYVWITCLICVVYLIQVWQIIQISGSGTKWWTGAWVVIQITWKVWSVGIKLQQTPGEAPNLNAAPRYVLARINWVSMGWASWCHVPTLTPGPPLTHHSCARIPRRNKKVVLRWQIVPRNLIYNTWCKMSPLLKVPMVVPIGNISPLMEEAIIVFRNMKLLHKLLLPIKSCNSMCYKWPGLVHGLAQLDLMWQTGLGFSHLNQDSDEEYKKVYTGTSNRE